jgi:hypothetical protein
METPVSRLRSGNRIPVQKLSFIMPKAEVPGRANQQTVLQGKSVIAPWKGLIIGSSLNQQ